jgi:hypothetical protein
MWGDVTRERRDERVGQVSIASDENELDIMEGELENISGAILDFTFDEQMSSSVLDGNSILESTLESSLALEVSDSSHGSYTLDNSDIQDIDSPSLHYGAGNKTI